MSGGLKIQLNFLPIDGDVPPFDVYRKLRREGEKRRASETFGFSLPVTHDSDKWSPYWVRFNAVDGFEKFRLESHRNAFVTLQAMFASICESAHDNLSDDRFSIPADAFSPVIYFNFETFDEGCRQLVVEPYFLRRENRFGWLVDFHFRVKPGVPFTRRIQQLSLSLDKGYRRNLNACLDRQNFILSCIEQLWCVLGTMPFLETQVQLSTAREFIRLHAKRLNPKSYVFRNGKESRSQFTGLRQHGPLSPISDTPRLLFAFRERDRQAARTLAVSLKGVKEREKFSYPGFEALFKSDLYIDGNPIILNDLSTRSFENALGRVKEERARHPTTIPIFVLPDGDDNGYKVQKALFTHEGIPTQTCTLRVVNDDYSLKWSIANIALQIFCKAGGTPWIVRPTQQKTLIIGISQSHKIHKDGSNHRVEKYFAFSVLTDNSGLFQEMRVLGEANDESTYLTDIKKNLAVVLKERASEFSQVVVHTSFRMKRSEMLAIEDTVRDAATLNQAQCRFAVVKVNHKNRFFGVNPNVNSLVPFEGTTVSLGGSQYLIWFEGIFPDNQTVTKAFPGPTHVSFLRVSEADDIQDEALLQDLVNLSGCNWRGFNAKSAPVSVFYCHLVADLVQDFHEAKLPLPRIQDLRPWFL